MASEVGLTSTSTSSSSSSSPAADSYIGSVISLVSKSEIRYEGILASLNTAESTIALNHVRSYGTEGRKKDGPQVLPSLKVYEYILFRGSDIKDLQVKSSPVVAIPETHIDPAIIQPRYPYAPASASSLSVGGGSHTDLSSHLGHINLALPSYPDSSFFEAGPQLSSGVFSTVPKLANAVSTPMYLPGCIGPSSGLDNAQQQSIPFQPPLAVHNELQYRKEMPNFSEHAATSNSTISPSVFSYKVSMVDDLSKVSTSLSGTASPSLYNALASLPSQLPTYSFGSYSPELIATGNPISLVGLAPVSLNLSSTATAQTPCSTTASPSLLITDTAKLSGRAAPSAQNLYMEHEGTEALLPSPPNLLLPVTAQLQAPLLPLPTPSQQFTEEFDFMAMNEKFKKNEVLGYLGKARQTGKMGDGTEDSIRCNVEVEEGDNHNSRTDHEDQVYKKDDFFDTLSSNSSNRGGQNGHPKFSERMKVDTETFGEFERKLPSVRGYHHASRARNYRGSYNRGRG